MTDAGRHLGSMPLPAGIDDAPRRGPLAPVELATAALLGAVTVVLVVAGSFLPHASGLSALGTVPMGVIAYRHRPRAVVAALVAGICVSFLVAGTSVISAIGICAVVGGLCGHAHRRRWGLLRLAAADLIVAPALGVLLDAVLWLLPGLRRVTLQALDSTWTGLTGLLARFPPLTGAAHAMDRWVAAAVRDWWLTVFGAVVVGILAATAGTWWILGGVLARLDHLRTEDRLAAASPEGAPGPPAPVPALLRGVEVRYPGADGPAVDGVDLDVQPGEAVVLLGPNGSGKSTLARVLAGAPVTAGTVGRPGRVGLGEPGGTALISQRPESQVLGVRVVDDVVWGLPPGASVDVDALLAAVGLDGMGGRDTSGLSGGELQRLAVAASLARRPRLLVSDESTAMVDAAGRQDLIDLYGLLPAARGVAVVHVTHRLAETAIADRVVRLDRGRIPASGVGVPAPSRPPDRARRSQRPLRPGRIDARGAGHVYAAGTPWAHPALRGVDLRVEPGEGVVVVGDNGSGKSTLAWALCGLLRPTEGTVELDGRPVADQVGRVALAFQHARLQLQRPTVGADVQAAAGIDRADAEDALGLVGLDPVLVWDRRIDELSGGQVRRVAIAGLLARSPAAIVLDEPMAGLDPDSRDILTAVLAELRRSDGLTVVVISHDLEGSEEICNRLVRLEHGAVVEDRAHHRAADHPHAGVLP